MATVTTYLDSELRKMSEAERDDAMLALVRGARRMPNGEIEELEVQLRAVERARGISTEAMRRMVHDGSLREDDEVCHWLITADLLDRLRSMQA